MSMYAKLMGRITESSLMDEEITVRYTFMMLLAIADPQGYVVGTDVAIARRLNMPLDDFKRCVNALMQPDPNSNSMEHEGRRVILSDCERGYFLVNYRKYRETRDEQQRREYMRAYMRKRRAPKDVDDVNNGKSRLAYGEGEGEGDKTPLPPSGGNGEFTLEVPTTPPEQKKTPMMLRIGKLFNRRESTKWDDKELKALRRIEPIDEADIAAIEKHYRYLAKQPVDYRKRDVLTLLNNWNGAVDQARKFREPDCL